MIIRRTTRLACSSETSHWRVLLTRRVFYHSFNTFSVCWLYRLSDVLLSFGGVLFAFGVLLQHT